MKLNWVTLQVSNLEKSVAFYSEFLNLDIAERFGNEEHQIVMLGKEEGTKVELIWEVNQKVEQAGTGVSIGFEADDFDGMLASIREQGVPVIGPISPNPHIRFFFIKDPDGYTVQLVEQR